MGEAAVVCALFTLAVIYLLGFAVGLGLRP